MAAGLSQHALTFPGCSTTYVSRLENGQRIPSLQIIRQLAARLGVSENWLARGVDTPDDPQLLAALASLCIRLGQLDQAEVLYADIEREAGSTTALARAAAGYGQIAFRRGAFPDAIELLERAYELDPNSDDPEALLALARSYLRTGAAESAIGHLRRLSTQADDPHVATRVALEHATALAAVGSSKEARRMLVEITDQQTDFGGAADQYALLAHRHSRVNPQTALGYAQKAHHLLDSAEQTAALAAAYQQLATADLDANQPADALSRLERATEIVGQRANPRELAGLTLTRARALAQLGKTKEALTTAAQVPVSDHTDLGEPLASLARTLNDQGVENHALELYEAALEQYRDDNAAPRRVLAEYAALLERVGRTKEAFAAYKKAATALPSLVF